MATAINTYQCPACTGPLHFAAGSGKLECEYCGSSYEVAEVEAIYAKKAAAAAPKPTCPACSAEVFFQPGEKEATCPSCGAEFEVEALLALAARQAEKKQDAMTWDTQAGSAWDEGETDGLRVYSCKQCGGEIVADETTGATHCPYCGNPVVLTGHFTGLLKPDLVIPFKVDKKAAVAALQNHYKGKLLLPKVFKDENHLREIQGIYVPVWLFDAKVSADIRYRAKKIKRWSDSNYRYTETKLYALRRQGGLSFSNVPVDGSEKMDDTMMESLEPFDIKQAVPFQTAYLSGYLADRYDVDADASIERANVRIRQSTLDEFRKTVQGYDSVDVEHDSIQLQNGQTKYALYPVWLLNTSWNDKKFTFGMNGQSGKFVGNLPIDKAKAAIVFGAVTVGVTIISFIIKMLMN